MMYFLSSSYKQDILPGEVGIEIGITHKAFTALFQSWGWNMKEIQAFWRR